MFALAETARFNKKHPGKTLEIGSFEEQRGRLHFEVWGDCSGPLLQTYNKLQKTSARVCESCGGLGRLKQYGNRKEKTLCRVCAKKYGKGGFFDKPDDALFDYMKNQSIQCDLGWYGLIFPLVVRLKRRDERQGGQEENTVMFYERDDKLRISIRGGDPDIGEYADKAEEESENICECCGCVKRKINRRVTSSYTKCYGVLCPNCDGERACVKRLDEIDDEILHDIAHEKRSRRVDHILPKFLSELSALTNKYGLKISENAWTGVPVIKDLEYEHGITYFNLKFNGKTKRYVLG
jgi:hypothetical protein